MMEVNYSREYLRPLWSFVIIAATNPTNGHGGTEIAEIKDG